MKKSTLLTTALLFLVSCAGHYQPPTQGKVAYLELPVSKENLDWIKGSSATKIHFGIAGEDGCARLHNIVEPTNKDDKNVSIIIPANKPIILRFLTYDTGNGIGNCTVKGAFIAKEGNKYQVLKFGNEYKCGLGLVEVNKNGKKHPVIMDKVQQMPFFNFCKI
ncbi:hypothetical protein C2869_17920 [Saccharobesus litoralis]|uniref:Lipoprotein n=1 Tax=Saccharobesus litoralis TaxID=2172099 RepID=A0A2S0VVD0_9ALTE|nr:hypothetical protein [Saccharobesus litoralis]AWB68176.1 hypothetical protein C2869_17920 [Saccharobesus litoralis]